MVRLGKRGWMRVPVEGNRLGIETLRIAHPYKHYNKCPYLYLHVLHLQWKFKRNGAHGRIRRHSYEMSDWSNRRHTDTNRCWLYLATYTYICIYCRVRSSPLSPSQVRVLYVSTRVRESESDKIGTRVQGIESPPLEYKLLQHNTSSVIICNVYNRVIDVETITFCCCHAVAV